MSHGAVHSARPRQRQSSTWPVFLEGVATQQRRAVASAFLDVAPCRSRVCLAPAVASSFIEDDDDGKEGDDEHPPTCFNKKGSVCNSAELGIPPHLQEKLDARKNALVVAINDGFCSDPTLTKVEDCEAAGGEWRDVEGDDLKTQLARSTAQSRVQRATLEKMADAYQASFEKLQSSFKSYKRELTVWQQALSGLEDDYTLHCRPFRDVSMECETQFRQAMHWWFAREPLPECEIGVVTPFLRNKTVSATSFAVLHLVA